MYSVIISILYISYPNPYQTPSFARMLYITSLLHLPIPKTPFVLLIAEIKGPLLFIPQSSFIIQIHKSKLPRLINHTIKNLSNRQCQLSTRLSRQDFRNRMPDDNSSFLNLLFRKSRRDTYFKRWL